MKKLLFILALIVCASCNNTVETDTVEQDYRVVVIDSCEYVMFDRAAGYHGFGFMAHKGNCKFCAERAKND